MSDSSSDSSTTTDAATYRDAPTTLLRFPLPECTHSQFRNYLEKTADMFHHLIFDYHQEKKACEDHGTQWQPDDALHETAYQTQLLTMAFLDGHYRTPALVIETINNLQRRAVVQLAIKNLKDLYPLHGGQRELRTDFHLAFLQTCTYTSTTTSSFGVHCTKIEHPSRHL